MSHSIPDFVPDNSKIFSKEQLKLLLIGPVLSNCFPRGQVKAYFKKLIGMTFRIKESDHPWRVSMTSLYRWVDTYRKKDPNLQPQTKFRSDKGHFRAIGKMEADLLRQVIDQNPSLSIRQILQVVQDQFPTKNLAYPTVHRFITRNKLLDRQSSNQYAVRPFEAPMVNYLWQTDIMNGPKLVGDHNRSIQTYLFAIIDDYSRFIIAAQFFFSQALEPFLSLLKSALMARGIPKILYTDNGKIYHSHRLSSIAAHLAIALFHTKPYASYQKGKIERFFRTVRMQFLSSFTSYDGLSLDELNQKFNQWITSSYHSSLHSSTSQTPFQRFFSQLPDSTNANSLKEFPEWIFDCILERKVGSDSVISLSKILFEVPQQLIGKHIRIRFDPDKLHGPDYSPDIVDSYGMPFAKAKPLNKTANCFKKRHLIDYSSLNQGD